MIGIRVDSNSIIATGHIMRCLSIARAIRKLNYRVLFISADENPRKLLESSGFNFISLNTQWNDLEQEEDILISVLKKYELKCLLIDSYHITPKYLEDLRKHLKISYLDDMDLFLYPVDMLINYNLCYDQFGYEKKYNQFTKLLLGTSYAPLREEFIGVSKKTTRRKVRNILVTSGGTDNDNVCGQIAKMLFDQSEFDNVNIHVVVGKFFTYKEILIDLSKNCSNIVLHENANMSQLMQECDIAVSAGGSTLYELCSCGTPTILFSIAENQQPICYSANQKGVAVYAGHYCYEVAEKIVKVAVLLDADKQKREELSNTASSLVDGKGAQRIAEALIYLAESHL